MMNTISNNATTRRMLTRRAFSTSHTFKLVSVKTDKPVMISDKFYLISLKFLELIDLKGRSFLRRQLQTRMN